MTCSCGLPPEYCVCLDVAKELQTLSIVAVEWADRTETVVWGFDFERISHDDASVQWVANLIESHLGRQTRIEANQIWLEGDHEKRVRRFLATRGFGLAEIHELPPDLRRSEFDNPDSIEEIRCDARMTADAVMMTGFCDPDVAASYLVYDDLETRRAATEALARFGAGPIEPLLNVLEESNDETVYSNALQALEGGLEKVECLTEFQGIDNSLVPFCEHPSALVRWSAVRALEKLIQHHSEEVDVNVVFASLIDLLNDRPKIRMTAANALGNLGDERALAPLEQLMLRTEPGSESHERARDAIQKLSAQE